MILPAGSCRTKLHGLIRQKLHAVPLGLLSVPGVRPQHIKLSNHAQGICENVDIDGLVRTDPEILAIRISLVRRRPIFAYKIRERAAKMRTSIGDARLPCLGSRARQHCRSWRGSLCCWWRRERTISSRRALLRALHSWYPSRMAGW